MNVRKSLAYIGFLTSALTMHLSANAGPPKTIYNWKALDDVRQIAVISPLFLANVDKNSEKSDVKKAAQAERKKLREVMLKSLLKRLGEQQRFRIIPSTKVDEALRKLHLTSSDLFSSSASLSGHAWPNPNTDKISKLASKLHCEGILLFVLRDPASVSETVKLNHETWSPNPLNIGLKRIRAHVLSPRVQGQLFNSSGIVAWRDEQMADHPRTDPRTEHTLQIDYLEATEQVASAIVDSLTRLPPPTNIR